MYRSEETELSAHSSHQENWFKKCENCSKDLKGVENEFAVQKSLDSENKLTKKISLCFDCVNEKFSEFDSVIDKFGAEAEICQKHQIVISTHFCVNCKVRFCVKCSVDHLNHKTTTLQLVTGDLKNKIDWLLDENDRDIEYLTEHSNMANLCLSQYNQTTTSITSMDIAKKICGILNDAVDGVWREIDQKEQGNFRNKQKLSRNVGMVTEDLRTLENRQLELRQLLALPGNKLVESFEKGVSQGSIYRPDAALKIPYIAGASNENESKDILINKIDELILNYLKEVNFHPKIEYCNVDSSLNLDFKVEVHLSHTEDSDLLMAFSDSLLIMVVITKFRKMEKILMEKSGQIRTKTLSSANTYTFSGKMWSFFKKLFVV